MTGQRLFGAHHHTSGVWIQTDDIQDIPPTDVQSPSLSHGEVNNPPVLAQNATIHVDDGSGQNGFWTQFFHQIPIPAIGNKADILAIGFFRHRQAITLGHGPRIGFGDPPKGKPQKRKLRRRCGKQKITLILGVIGAAVHADFALCVDALDIMTRGQKITA